MASGGILTDRIAQDDGGARGPEAARRAEDPAASAAADAAVVRRVLAGERDAFRLLVEKHQARVYRAARRIVRDADEAEDVAQEAFVKAYTHLASYDPRWAFATWLMTIATRTALNTVRDRERGPARATEDGATRSGERVGSLEELPPQAEPRDRAPGPRQRAAESEWLERLKREVEGLGQAMRVVFGLRYEDNLSIREIADATRSSESAVKVTLHRARARLRERLREFSEYASVSQFE